MNSTFYLPRRLSNGDRTYTESELLAAANYVVILAEPGAGKTELMNSLAQQLNTSPVTASKFRYSELRDKNLPLVIDAFDELAKIASSSIYELLGKAESASPSHVYLSSRSSEWDQASTHAFREFFDGAVLEVRLCEFDDEEQRAIFNHHQPNEDFSAFKTQVSRFDLEVLLPNPQFLTLFADAYIESNRYFTDKRSIFSQAVERLAKEASAVVARSSSNLTSDQKIALSSEVFTKLMLSGAEGVSSSEATEDRMYPSLASLIAQRADAYGILASRLFKPGDSTNQHRPVHKIVSEYCAAKYITQRITDPSDSLTLPKCLTIIAPNNTVRDELRGVLGWMAALGNLPIQEAAINLDPYAVLANGDPSQLQDSAKRQLVQSLKKIADQDPYFRRGDYWRRFSAAGFFTQEVIDEMKPLLATGGDSHLRDLLLELLADSPAIKMLSNELWQLALTPTEDPHSRLLANRCLLALSNEHRLALAVLLFEASQTSLNMAAELIAALGPNNLERTHLAGFFRICARLYPGHRERLERPIGEHYFVNHLIAGLDQETVEWLLDELTRNLACSCGKHAYECDCRTGISKIVGSMLDRYFELASPPFDPRRIWQWVGNLNYHETPSAKESKAVKVLQENDELRQGILALVFGELNDAEQIIKIQINWNHQAHAGLRIRSEDELFLVDLAFDNDNPVLWSRFMARHQYYYNNEKRGPNSLRRHMRQQALEKPSFMWMWAKNNRWDVAQLREQRKAWLHRNNRRTIRHRRKEEKIRQANIRYLRENREQVESGSNWNCLFHFAELVLMKPDNIKLETGDESLVHSALRNCLGFIAPRIPDLAKFAELQCASQSLHTETILYAACLEIIRNNSNLDGVDHRLLQALRTNIYMGYSAVSDEERNTLKAEIDRIIFPDAESTEQFLRQYLEPQLAETGCGHAEVWLLRREDVFSPLRAPLSIEWLRRFDDLAISPLEELFEIAAEHAHPEELQRLIAERCATLMACWPQRTNDESIEKKCNFWLLRAFYFLNDAPEDYWNWLKADKDSIFLLYGRSGRMNRSEHPHWPALTSHKVEDILDAFIDQWPKVELPNQWGSSSPKEEKAYRFLTEVIWSINSDHPDDALPVLSRLLASPRFTVLHKDLQSIYSTQIRKKALIDFVPPTPADVSALLDRDTVITVEGLRQRVIQELQDFQKAINGGEFNSADRFYEKGERLDEVRCTEIIAERLHLRLEPSGIVVTPEHQLKAAKRSDFTVTKILGGMRKLLVTEVKGQWHSELYTAASAQLYERYSIHPDAEHQGIFLVIWFGTDEKVAGRIKHGITNAVELRNSIEAQLPPEFKQLIDVFVLDVSKKQ